MRARSKFETPGSLTIMSVYLGLFFVAWALWFLYLGVRWAIS